ncbi:NTP pyrophosphohydrolase [Candidatus Magnetomorum sp. HK-1]|nr:NTP pyrophosphohydrolase [Candidatus Magnetomorum sp. HK-1]
MEENQINELVHSFITYDYNNLSINTEELDDGKFFSIATIEKNLGKQIFTPNFEAEFKLIKAISHPEIKKI